MAGKRRIRMVLDAAMTALMVLEMAFLATGTAFHEYAGIVLFVLFIAHHVLNVGWYKGLFRGKWPLLRVVMTVLNFVLLALMLAEAVTGTMLSQVIFKGLALPDGGLLARQLHSAAAYWGLLLMGTHLGLHWAGILAALRKKLHLQPSKARTWLCRIFAAALVLLALREWVAKEVWAKLTMYYAYSFYDSASNAVLYTLGFLVLLAAAAALSHYAVQMYRAKNKQSTTKGASTVANVLTVYYSRKGENYFGGSIRSVAKGNTEILAEAISDAVGGDLFEIDTVKPYSANYTTCTEEAQEELRTNARPELKEYLDDLDEYDTIFVGYPNWWGTCPMAVFSFFEHYDLTGKRVIPFCTNEGSGMGHSEADLSKVCAGATVEKGLAIRGSDAAKSIDKAADWAKKSV